MTGLQLPPFRIIHAAFVTHDLDAGKRRLAAMFGVKDFIVCPEMEVGVPGGAARIAFALAHSHGTPLEVIQPLGGMDSVYREALTADPANIAFHHFATNVENAAEWQMVKDAIENHGLDTPIMGGEEPAGCYVYLDTRPQLGHMLEFIWGYSEEGLLNSGIDIRRERIG